MKTNNYSYSANLANNATTYGGLNYSFDLHGKIMNASLLTSMAKKEISKVTEKIKNALRV